MPLTTTLDDRVKDVLTGHKELDAMLAEARQVTGVDWQVKRVMHHRRQWWRPWRETATMRVQLLLPAPGFPSWQVVLMGGDAVGTMGWVPVSDVLAYLWGAVGQAEWEEPAS